MAFTQILQHLATTLWKWYLSLLIFESLVWVFHLLWNSSFKKIWYKPCQMNLQVHLVFVIGSAKHLLNSYAFPITI